MTTHEINHVGDITCFKKGRFLYIDFTDFIRFKNCFFKFTIYEFYPTFLTSMIVNRGFFDLIANKLGSAQIVHFQKYNSEYRLIQTKNKKISKALFGISIECKISWYFVLCSFLRALINKFNE